MFAKTIKYFSGLRRIEFIYMFKLSALLFIFFFSNSMLNNIKETMIDTTDGGGIELVPYLKGVFLPITTISFLYFYNLMSKFFSTTVVFCIIFSFFILYYTFYGLYPPFPQISSGNLIIADGKFVNAILMILNIYRQSIFYVISDLWENITISFILIQFFNRYITNRMSKYVYPILFFFGNLALIISSITIDLIHNYFNNWFLSFSYILYIIVFFITLAFFICIKLDPKDNFLFLKEKKIIISKFRISKNSIIIFILVFSYASLLPITDIIWKKNLSLALGDNPIKYSSFIAMATKYTGVVLMIMGLVLKPLLLKLRWKQLALLTPLSYIFLFIPIFLLIELDKLHIFKEFKYIYIIASYIGAFQASIFYSLKYMIDSVIKNMIVLEKNGTNHIYSKLYVEIVNYKFGKTFSAWLMIVLFSLCQTIDLQDIYPYIFIYIIFILFIWICTIYYSNGNPPKK